MFKLVLKLSLAILLLPMVSCGINFKTQTTGSRDYPDFILGDFKYISADLTGLREWELRAREAKMYNAKNEVYLYNLAITFYNESNRVKSFVSANHGYVDKVSMDIYAEGKVKILSDNQAVLEANRVNWDNTKKVFFSAPDELVTLRRGNTVVLGYKMVADSGLKEVRLEQVQADIKK